MRLASRLAAVLVLVAAPSLAGERAPRPEAPATAIRTRPVALHDSLGGAGLILLGEQLGDRFGDPAAAAGDVNGDGFADVIVGAWAYGESNSRKGRAYVFLGHASGLDTVPVWMRGSSNPGAYFGISVAGAGDVDRDGYDDVLVGAGRDSAESEGRAFLYRGGPAGPDTTPAWSGRGLVTYSWFGTSVSGVGDVNGDGFADVAIGAPNYPGPGGRTGAAFVYYGSAGGLSTTGVPLIGELPGEWFGYCVAPAGDTNDDGYDDVVIGAVYASHGLDKEGRAYLYLGSASGIGTSPAWTVDGENLGASLGYSLRGVGDVNVDGYDDVVIGAQHYDTTGVAPLEGQGRAFLYLGNSAGLSPTPSWWVTGTNAQAHLGRAVGNARDINGDGINDMAVTVLRYTGGQISEGRVDVFYGRAGIGPSTIPDWKFESNRAFLSLGQSVAGAGDINYDGAPDLVAGTSGPSEDVAPVLGEVYVFYGIRSPVAVGEPAPSAGPAVLHAPAPQPFHDRVRLSFALTKPGRARLDVLDLSGRRVATPLDQDLPGGEGAVFWNGRDANGRRCAAGVYVVRLAASDARAHRLVTLLR